MNYQDMVGSLRRHWRIAAGVIFASFLVSIGYYLTRPPVAAEKEFQAIAKFVLPTVASTRSTASNAAPVPATPAADLPKVLTNNYLHPALADETINQAKKQGNLKPDPPVSFKAELNETETVITLTTSSSNKKQANKGLEAYADAFTDARAKAVNDDAVNQQRTIQLRLTELNRRQREIEGQLRRRVDPLPSFVLVNPDGSGAGDKKSGGAVILELPDNTSQHTRLLAYERNSIYSSQIRLEARYGALSLLLVGTDPYIELLVLTKADRVEVRTPSPLLPMAAIMGIGILMGLAAALFFDNLDSTIHNSLQAETALSSLVFTSIPARHHFEDQYADPGRGGSAARAAAYRQLAATSVATDRLPRALLVTSPTSDSQDGVALNYAAALAGLGLRVALIATTPDQAWFLEPLGHTALDPILLPDLLALAHNGTIGDALPAGLAKSADAPNLFMVPPGETEDLDLPLDGLAPLLAAMEAADFDVTIVAGPSMLNDANATIFAWSIRNVLWTVETHQVNEGAAREAAAHLELTGGTAFGVAVVGQEI